MVNRTSPFTYNHYQRSTFSFDSNRSSVATLADNRSTVTLGTNSQTGTDNRNWKVLVRKGLDASNVYTRIVYSGKSSRSHAITRTRNPGPPVDYITGDDYIHQLSGFDLVNQAGDTALADLALTRLKRRLNSNIGRIEALTPIAELREFYQLVRQMARLSRTFLRTILEIRASGGRSVTLYSAEAWLAYSFGMRPLVSDTERILSAISDYLNRSDRSVRLRGSASKTWVSSKIDGPFTGAFGAPVSHSIQVTHTLSYRYTAGLNLRIKSGNNYGIMDALGLTVEQMPVTAVELIPFAWMANYFSNLSEYLNDTFVLPPGSITYLTRSAKYTMDGTIRSFHKASTSDTVILQDFCSPGYLNYTGVFRTVLAALPHTGFHFNSADQIAASSVTRLLNLLSILATGRRT